MKMLRTEEALVPSEHLTCCDQLAEDAEKVAQNLMQTRLWQVERR